jgi:hypothetical protein
MIFSLRVLQSQNLKSNFDTDYTALRFAKVKGKTESRATNATGNHNFSF